MFCPTAPWLPLSCHCQVTDQWSDALLSLVLTWCLLHVTGQRPEGTKTPSHQGNWLVSDLQKAWMLFTKVHIYNNLSDLQLPRPYPDPEQAWGLLDVSNSHRQFWQEGMWKVLILPSTDSSFLNFFLHYT